MSLNLRPWLIKSAMLIKTCPALFSGLHSFFFTNQFVFRRAAVVLLYHKLNITVSQTEYHCITNWRVKNRKGLGTRLQHDSMQFKCDLGDNECDCGQSLSVKLQCYLHLKGEKGQRVVFSYRSFAGTVGNRGGCLMASGLYQNSTFRCWRENPHVPHQHKTQTTTYGSDVNVKAQTSTWSSDNDIGSDVDMKVQTST